MKIFIFGNPEVEMDSLPIRILPTLKVRFPKIEFVLLDPNEEWNIPEEIIAIDTVVGIEKITIFDNLKYFANSPRISLHDFDAFLNLVYLNKLGKLKKVVILGVPVDADEKEAINDLTNVMEKWYRSQQNII